MNATTWTMAAWGVFFGRLADMSSTPSIQGIRVKDECVEQIPDVYVPERSILIQDLRNLFFSNQDHKLLPCGHRGSRNQGTHVSNGVDDGGRHYVMVWSGEGGRRDVMRKKS